MNEKEKLLAEISSLRSKIAELENNEMKFKRVEEELLATNQQLDASNQQLRLREEDLKLEQENLKRTQKIAHVGSWEWDVKSDIVSWTDELFKIFRLDPKKGAVSYADHHKIYTSESMQKLDKAVQHTLETGNPYEIDLEIIRGDGTNAFCTARGIAKKDNEGNVIKLYGSFQDNTKRIKAEKALRQNEEKISAVINNSPFPVAVVDVNDQNILFWSKSALQLFGHKPKTTEEWYELAYPDPKYRQEVIERWKPLLEKAQNSKKVVNTGEYEIHCKNGTVKTCEIYAQFIPGNLVVTLNDITARKNSEEHLKALNQQLVANEQQLRSANQQLHANEQQLLAANQQLMASEKQLLESKKTAERYLNISSEIILSLDLKGNIRMLNDSGSKLLGYKKGELIGKEWFSNCLPKEKVEAVRAVFDQILQGKIENMSKYESDILTKSGEIKTIFWHNTMLKDKNGQIYGTLSSGEDVTEQRLAEKAMHESEEKFRSLFYSMQEGVYLHSIVYDDNGNAINYRIIEANDISEKYLNIKKQGAIGKLATELFGTEEAPFLEIYSKVAETGEPYTFEQFFEPMQKHFFISVFSPGKGDFATIFLDVTDKKLTEIALKESEQRFRLLTENAKDTVYRMSIPEAVYEYVSPAAKEIFGYTPKEFYSAPQLIKRLIHPDWENYFKIEWQKLLEGNIPPSYEYQIINKSGEVKWLNQRNTLIKDKEGKPIAIEGLVTDITDRKRTEIELLKATEKATENEEKYRLLHENAGLGIGYLSPEGIVLSFNATAAKDMNGIPEDFKGKSIFDLFPKNAADSYFERLQTSVNSDKIEVYEDFVQLPKQRKWFLSTYSKIVNSQNKILGIQIISQDITQIKQSEIDLKNAIEKAEKSKANITAIIEGNNNSIWAFNRNYQILYINHIFQEDFLRSFGVLLKPGMSLIEALPKPLQPFWKPRYDRVLANEQFTLEDAVPTEIGTIYIQVTFNPIVKNGKVIGGSCFGNDITQRKLSELELIEAKEKAEESATDLKLAQDIANIGNWQFDPETGVPEWSDYIYKIYERNPEEGPLHIDDYKNIYEPDQFEIFSKSITAAIKEGKNYDIVLKLKVSDKKVKWVRAICKPDLNRKTETGYFLRGTIQDITNLKKTELELQKAKEKAEESDRLKSAFLANMSHEIRTPMNGILGFTNLLQQPDLTGEKQQKYIDIIQKSGVRMLNTVNDIIDISRIESGQAELSLSEVNINEQMTYLYSFFKPEAEKKGIKLVFKKDNAVKNHKFITDSDKFNSIVTNLIKNAIKFTEKGFIELGYNLKKEKDSDEVQFYVKDSGAGIPKQRQSAIFERFVQADIEDKQAKQGSGLGLAISKAFAEMLGGKIWLDSEEGKGSTFYFTIENNPSSKTKPNSLIGTHKSKEENITEKLNILIVEDDEISQQYISLVVEEFANKIIAVASGSEAVEACRNNPEIDLILMDIQLPGKNGYEVSREIRNFNKDVVIIAQTAYALTGDREKAIENGCNDYISKPVDKEELITKINNFRKN